MPLLSRRFARTLPKRPDLPGIQRGVADADPTLLPWGYGVDRVTAMVVDPTRLLVYWEVTDEGIARARARLAPPAQEAATLALRIYDVTSIIFDGTNAHAETSSTFTPCRP